MRALACIALATRVAAAGPALDHVLTAPTAWLPAENAIVVTGGLDHHGGALVGLGYGLGRIGEISIGADSDDRACTACSHDDPAPEIYLARAAFRIGAPPDAWFAGQPGVALGVRTTIGGTRRAAEAYVVASEHLGLATLHVGAIALDADDAGMRLGTHARAFAGAELVPPQYPKTTVLADVGWLVTYEPQPVLEYALGWGVRYQALAWGSIELDVRHRQDERGSPTVMVRVNGVWSP